MGILHLSAIAISLNRQFDDDTINLHIGQTMSAKAANELLLLPINSSILQESMLPRTYSKEKERYVINIISNRAKPDDMDVSTVNSFEEMRQIDLTKTSLTFTVELSPHELALFFNGKGGFTSLIKHHDGIEGYREWPRNTFSATHNRVARKFGIPLEAWHLADYMEKDLLSGVSKHNVKGATHIRITAVHVKNQSENIDFDFQRTMPTKVAECLPLLQVHSAFFHEKQTYRTYSKDKQKYVINVIHNHADFGIETVDDFEKMRQIDLTQSGFTFAVELSPLELALLFSGETGSGGLEALIEHHKGISGIDFGVDPSSFGVDEILLAAYLEIPLEAWHLADYMKYGEFATPEQSPL